MKRTPHLLIGAVSALAIMALPLDSMMTGSLEPSAAFAKNGNGGGNGNGGKGHGGEHGNSGHAGERGKSGNGGGKGQAGERGKSAHGQRGKRGGSGLEAPGKPKAIASQDSRGKGKSKAGKWSETKVAKSSRKSARALEVAELPEEVLVPAFKPDKHKLNARLAGLNSLKRNYRAYLNSQSPRMASIRAFVMASANLDIANEALAAARAEFDTALAEAGLTPFDDPLDTAGIYDDPSLTDLEDRLAELDAIDPAALTPEEQDALQAERTTLESLLDSEEANSLAEAEDTAEAATVGTDDETLRQALIDGANQNRIAQYGEDYVNEDVMSWAKDVLGVGEDFGKIDEVRETLQIDQQ
jgi:hypothetical protein